MKFLLIVTTWAFPPMIDSQPRGDIVTGVNYIKSFATREACEAAGKEIAVPAQHIFTSWSAYKCIQERE